MGSGNDSILDMYLYETNTLLEQLDGILLAAEQADTFSQDSVNEIFRTKNTLNFTNNCENNQEFNQTV